MARQSKHNWRKLWSTQHHRAFKVATTLPTAHLNAVQDQLAALIRARRGPRAAIRVLCRHLWRQQMPPRSWGLKS